MVGTNKVASEVGLGAGASVAATFWVADAAINIIITAKKSLIFKASIVNFLWKSFAKCRECVEERKCLLKNLVKCLVKGGGLYGCGRREKGGAAGAYGQAAQRDRCTWLVTRLPFLFWALHLFIFLSFFWALFIYLHLTAS